MLCPGYIMYIRLHVRKYNKQIEKKDKINYKKQ